MAVFDVAQICGEPERRRDKREPGCYRRAGRPETQLEAMGMWELIGLWPETNIINLCMGGASPS